MRRPISTMSARRVDSALMRSGPVLVAAHGRAEVEAAIAGADRDRALADDEGAADRIAFHRHAVHRRPPWRRRTHAFDDAVDDPPERAGDDGDQDEQEDLPQHHSGSVTTGSRGSPGMRRFQAVDRALGRLALGAASGAILSACCQACSAPARSCLPKARTNPRFSHASACFGFILTDRSSCCKRAIGLVRVVVRHRQL